MNLAHRPESALLEGPAHAADPIGIPAPTDHCLPERRDATSREALVRRVIAEYLEMPGLRLTFAQAQRLFGLPAATCARVLETLVRREILRVDPNRTFVRGGGWP